MKVLVDTAVWSLAFRRGGNRDGPHVALLRELIRDGRAVLIGAVRQEVLSGIHNETQFKQKAYFRAFPDLELSSDDYELAAEFFNTCRRRGIQGANTDFLICAASTRREFEILTTDKDFRAFGEFLPITLYSTR